MLLIYSCGSTRKAQKQTFILVYEQKGYGDFPAYLILYMYSHIYNKYDNKYSGGSIGEYKISNDTLFLSPLYYYSDYYDYEHNWNMSMNRINPNDTIESMTQVYIFEKDSLIEITNYSFEPFLDIVLSSKRDGYKLLKQKYK